MKPLFLILEPPMLMVFWRSTRPVYFSLDNSLLRTSRFHLGLLVGDGMLCPSSVAAILPKLLPLKSLSKIQRNIGLIRGDDQFSVWGRIVTVAAALDHLGGAVLEASSKIGSDGLAFFNVLHRNLSFPKNESHSDKITVAC